jgi:hypothetical protein
LVESLYEVAYGQVLSNTSTPFVPLPVPFTSGGPVLIGLLRGCVGRQLICGDVLEIPVSIP